METLEKLVVPGPPATASPEDDIAYEKAELLFGYRGRGGLIGPARIGAVRRAIDELRIPLLDHHLVKVHQRAVVRRALGCTPTVRVAKAIGMLVVGAIVAWKVSQANWEWSRPAAALCMVAASAATLLTLPGRRHAWGYTDIDGVDHIPGWVLRRANALKERTPFAHFYIEALGLDPFLVVECHGMRWYIAVWGEPGLEQLLLPKRRPEPSVSPIA